MLNKELIMQYEDAIFEAERFLEKANAALKELKNKDYSYYSKTNASAKRSSMDLSNALVIIRK